MHALHTPRFLTLVLFLLIGGAGSALAANLGVDDQQISFTGAPGTTATDAFTPATAFAPASQRYLVVWSADATDGDFHIWGRLLTGAGGVPIGEPFRISPDGAPGSDQRQPAVAVDTARDRFFVVWSGDGDAPGAYEIQGQLVAADGTLVGGPTRLSDMGSSDSDGRFDAVTPDVAWHGDLDRFVVVWAADDDTGQLSDGRFELYGQLVDAANGAETGTNDFRISFAGPDYVGNDVLNPALAVEPGTERWYVAFEADIMDNGVHDSEVFMYGVTGDIPDANGYEISLMGGGIEDGLTARHPDLAWAADTGRLVCVWDGTNSPGLKRAVYGQIMNTDGSKFGLPLDLSGAGPLREAAHPNLAIDPLTGEWFVSWQGSEDVGTPYRVPEVWARRFAANGAPQGFAADILSAMNPTFVPVAGAGKPAVAVNSVLGTKLIAWSGDLASTFGGEHEVFTQAWTDNAVTAVDDTPTAAAFALHGAAPNPFNPLTRIAFDLPLAAPVTLRIYSASGRLVRNLLSEAPGLAGRNEVVWDGRDSHGRQAASGVYLYRLETTGHSARGRMTLVK